MLFRNYGKISDANEYDVKRNKSNRIKQLGQLTKILRKGREEDWVDDSDFQIDEYDYFVSIEKSDVGPGSFKDLGYITDEKIEEIKCTAMKESPTATKSELISILAQKFYGDSGICDLKLSFKLNQCIRSGSDCFEDAKDYLLNEGYNIWRNEFF